MRVDVQGIEFSYGCVDALQDVSVSVEASDLVSIVGPNGSGKSTLLRCINRLLRPDAGSVLIDGTDVRDLGRNERAKTLGYVPQEQRGNFPATVFDVVLMGRKPHIDWKPTEADVDTVWSILEELEIDEFASRDINELSGGQRQKVVMARALAQEPDVLLLDEPTSNLDLKHQLQVLDIAKRQTDRGVTVFLVIHDLNLAARYSDTVLLLKGGAVYAAGGVDVLSADNIEPVYDVNVSVEDGAGQPFIVPESVGHRDQEDDPDRADEEEALTTIGKTTT